MFVSLIMAKAGVNFSCVAFHPVSLICDYISMNNWVSQGTTS